MPDTHRTCGHQHDPFDPCPSRRMGYVGVAERAHRELDRAHDHIDAREYERALAELSMLTYTADQLIRQVIKLARKDGLSWTAIGGQFGVSKQAAQQRWG